MRRPSCESYTKAIRYSTKAAAGVARANGGPLICFPIYNAVSYTISYTYPIFTRALSMLFCTIAFDILNSLPISVMLIRCDVCSRKH